jgi:hypothetical protein
MLLKELQDYFKGFEENHTFDFGLSQPFSWRGSYDEVAFAVIDKPYTREEILSNIQMAYAKTYTGYKGGEFEYYDYTEVHFEQDSSAYTNGEYARQWIESIVKEPQFQTLQERMVRLMFKQ